MKTTIGEALLRLVEFRTTRYEAVTKDTSGDSIEVIDQRATELAWERVMNKEEHKKYLLWTLDVRNLIPTADVRECALIAEAYRKQDTVEIGRIVAEVLRRGVQAVP